MALKKPINTSKIAVGDCITYKKLCNLLGIETYTGKQKQIQLEMLQRHFDYNKVGTKYLITEIYEKPLPKEYKYPVNAIYIQYIECILLQYLSLQKENHTYISSQKLWLQLGMINDKFIEKGETLDTRKELLELSPEMTNYDIYDFYKRCRSKLSDILNKSLDSLSKRFLIKYNKTYLIGRKINNVDIFEEATVDEIEEILKIERETLEELGLQNEQQVFLMNLTMKFYKTINRKCNERFGWEKVFKCYHIIYNKKNVIEALPADKIALQKSTLNSKIIDSINTQAQNLYNRSISNKEQVEENIMKQLLYENEDQSSNEEGESDGVTDISDMKYYEYKDNYVEMQELLSDELLKIN